MRQPDAAALPRTSAAYVEVAESEPSALAGTPQSLANVRIGIGVEAQAWTHQGL